jgi:hypothetical protein
MRAVLVLTLLIALTASADAAMVRRSKPLKGHFRTYQHVTVRSGQRAAAPTRFAVPGWTDEQTDYWLDNASAAAGLD